jgi:hypothetical protein
VQEELPTEQERSRQSYNKCLCTEHYYSVEKCGKEPKVQLFTFLCFILHKLIKYSINNHLNSYCWCLDCGAIPNEDCKGNHSILLNQMDVVVEIKALMKVVSNNLSQAIKKR